MYRQPMTTTRVVHTGYADEATEIMQRPEFIAARTVWFDYMRELAATDPKKRTQAMYTHASRLQKATQETTGLQAYKKTWKIIASRLVAEGI